MLGLKLIHVGKTVYNKKLRLYPQYLDNTLLAFNNSSI